MTTLRITDRKLPMELSIDKNYRIRFNPLCSSKCLVTCEWCKVDAVGKYTGRNWADRDGEMLYEFVYKEGERNKVGIYKLNEIECI